MKKTLIVFGLITFFVAASAFVLNNKKSNKDGGPTCVTVGNCEVQLRGPSGKDSYSIWTINRNNYRVTVSWTAYGYTEGSTQRIKCGSGTIVSEPAPNGTGNNPTGTGHFNSGGLKYVHLDGVRVQKCN